MQVLHTPPRAVLDTNTIVSGLGWGGTPADVLDAALAGEVDVIVTGDQELLSLRQVDQIRIMTPRELLDTQLTGLCPQRPPVVARQLWADPDSLHRRARPADRMGR